MSAVRVRAAALLLDMDGTLVHSTGDVEVVWRRWCQHHGLDPAPVLAMCHGVRSGEVIGALAPQLDMAVEVALLDDLEMEYAAAPMPLDGARRLLEQLPPTRWALVTSASRRVAEHRLLHAGLPLPRLLVCAGDVVRGKPDPEPYLLAASRLGLAPADCLVFEDAPAGIASALQAGCQVVQMGGTRRYDDRLKGWLRDWRGIEIEVTPDGLHLHLPAPLPAEAG
ncbi:HAD-IA family hydrolase [Aeromonas caviae]|uniref:HAD-IA family hydrolase n=1 Tax=Aeromonas caviae TaxID=648 RepID=UPI003429B463